MNNFIGDFKTVQPAHHSTWVHKSILSIEDRNEKDQLTGRYKSVGAYMSVNAMGYYHTISCNGLNKY